MTVDLLSIGRRLRTDNHDDCTRGMYNNSKDLICHTYFKKYPQMPYSTLRCHRNILYKFRLYIYILQVKFLNKT